MNLVVVLRVLVVVPDLVLVSDRVPRVESAKEEQRRRRDRRGQETVWIQVDASELPRQIRHVRPESQDETEGHRRREKPWLRHLGTHPISHHEDTVDDECHSEGQHVYQRFDNVAGAHDS